MPQRSDETMRCVLTIIGQVWWQRGNAGNNAKINEAIMMAKNQRGNYGGKETMIAMPRRSDEATRCVLSAPGADPTFSFPWQ